MGQWLSAPLKEMKFNPDYLGFWTALSRPIGGFLFAWMRLVEWTSRVKVIGSLPDHPEAVIYVNWHQHLPFLITHHGRLGRWMLVSRAPYMEPIARWCVYSGLRLVRGGSGDGGRSAVLSLQELLKKNESIVIAVDGPAGPAFEVKRGCLELARATGAEIVPVSYRCQSASPNKKRWDYSLRPTFFDQIEIEYGDPIRCDPDRSDQELLLRIKQALGQ
mgnify:CR=1 FL=1